MSSPAFEKIKTFTREQCEAEIDVICRMSEILSRPEANTHSNEWQYLADWKQVVKDRLAELKI